MTEKEKTMVVKYAPFVNGSLKEYVGSNYPADFANYRMIKQEDGSYRREETPGEWREVADFPAVMTFAGWERGRSAVRLNWTDQDGHEYPMFMKDFADILDGAAVIESGGNAPISINAVWTVQKRGANYGIRIA